MQRSLEIAKFDSLAFGNHQVHGEENDRGSVDRHRNTHIIQRNAAKKNLHVGDGIHRDAAASDFASRSRIVGVVAHERRHVEGH